MTLTGDRLLTSLTFPSYTRPMELPWPMTRREAVRWLLVSVSAWWVSTLVVAVVTFVVTDSELWCVAVPVLWLVAFRLGGIPWLARRHSPGDVDARWDRWLTQERETDHGR